MINLEELHTDNRGIIWVFHYKDREYLLFTIKKNAVRGGDYHKSTQHDIVLEGKVECRVMRDDSYEESGYLTEGDKVTFYAGQPHVLIGKADSLVLEWLEGEFEKEYYEPYRRLCE